jgi:hypothetical protein
VNITMQTSKSRVGYCFDSSISVLEFQEGRLRRAQREFCYVWPRP